MLGSQNHDQYDNRGPNIQGLPKKRRPDIPLSDGRILVFWSNTRPPKQGIEDPLDVWESNTYRRDKRLISAGVLMAPEVDAVGDWGKLPGDVALYSDSRIDRELIEAAMKHMRENSDNLFDLTFATPAEPGQIEALVDEALQATGLDVVVANLRQQDAAAAAAAEPMRLSDYLPRRGPVEPPEDLSQY